MQHIITLSPDRHRFAMLTSGIGIAVCISSTYCFSIFSNSLKSDYNLGQDDITTISTIGTACGLFSMPAGIMFDYVGPQVVLFLATMIMGMGYLLWMLAFSGVINGGLILFCIANSCGCGVVNDVHSELSVASWVSCCSPKNVYGIRVDDHRDMLHCIFPINATALCNVYAHRGSRFWTMWNVRHQSASILCHITIQEENDPS